MRALLLENLGEVPQVGDSERPTRGTGESILAVAAAPFNPIDVSVASGRFFAGHPPLPYIPGVEATGRIAESDRHPVGALVFTCLDGLGTQRDGTCAEFVKTHDDAIVPLPDGADPVVCAAVGTAGLAAWIPLTQLIQITDGDTVLVLGATGSAGRVAVQAAKLLGARRVVAAGRNAESLERARELGADDTVDIDNSVDLAADFARACGETGPTVIFDPLWGEPLVAALRAAAPGARVIQLGQSAGAEAAIPSALVRGKSLSILGYTNLNVPMASLAESYLALLHEVLEGRIVVDVTSVALDEAPAAWRRQASGASSKIVVRL